MEDKLDILALLSQRRVWASIISALSFLINMLHIEFRIDVPVLTDMLTGIGAALAALISAILALWSYLKPKSQNERSSNTESYNNSGSKTDND